MTTPNFGIVFNLIDDAPLPPFFGDFSVLGIALPSDDADADMFPLDTPVDINTGELATLAALGTGPLYKTILRINSQLADLERSARAVVVRVATGVDDDHTIANIIGDPNAGSGIYAFLRAPQLLGVTPRILGAPGFTGQFTTTGGSTGVTRAAKSGGNTGAGTMTLGGPAYLTGSQAGIYQVRCIGGATSASSAPKAGGNTGNGALGSVTSDVDAIVGDWRVVCEVSATDGGTFAVIRPDGGFDGVAVVGTPYDSGHGPNFVINDSTIDFIVGDEFVVTVVSVVPTNGGTFSVKDPHGTFLANAVVGTPYAHQISFTIADGSPDFIIGDGFDVTVTVTGGQVLANPICAALPAVCEAMLACAIVGGPGTTKTDAISWEDTMNSKRMIPVDNWEIIGNGVDTEFIDGAASTMGVAVRVDFQHGGFPFWSFANQPVQGLLGLKRVDSFSLVDGATDAQELLALNIGVTVRGDHSDVSLTDSGFQLICYGNAGDDPQWQLLNKVRGRDFIHLALLKSIRHRLGKDNVTLHGVQAVLNDMAAIAADLKAKECVIGWSVGFRSADNTTAGLRAGRFTVFFNAEQPAPILQVTIDSGLDQAALDAELAALSTELSDITQTA